MKQFQLKIIDVKNILPHEEYDMTRASALVDKIKKRGVFTNPILVAHVGGDTYMQIDGMNRYSAIKKLGIPSILAQVVDYNDPSTLDVSTWTHLHAIEKADFLKKLEAIPGISVGEVGFRYLRRRYIKDSGTGYLCTVAFDDMSVFRVASNGKLPQKVQTLAKIVGLYKDQIKRDILPDDANSIDIEELFKKHAKKTLVLFPSFTRHQIIECAIRSNVLFPGGITRFIIMGRCLDVNLPLTMLSTKKSATEKNKELEEFLSQKRYRMYQEPTIYFEP